MDRRRFFREGLRELLGPVSRAVEPIHRVAKELGNLDRVAPTTPPAAPAPPPPELAPPAGAIARGSQSVPAPETNWLRPPGALPEDEFLATCSRCSKCVEVCPVQCIKIDPDRTLASGAPYIDVNAMPCVLCNGLQCMNHCPSGALLPTPLADIDMGTAVWHQHLCVRTYGEDCTMCVDHCPVGPKALELSDGFIAVREDGCVGCGVCQSNCPTDPKSITVTPRALRFTPH